MIEVSCVNCGKTIKSFASFSEYVKWRDRADLCECGGYLGVSIRTVYKPGEPPKQEEKETRGIFRR
jgi:hypothetical protein